MSSLRKFALIVLIVALAPAMVLAGMPVKYCKASVGQHHAIEFVIDGVSHGGDHASHHDGEAVRAAHYKDCGPAVIIEAEACTDTALTQLASAPNLELQFALPALSIAPLPRLVFPGPALSIARHSFESASLRPDPRLPAHRITVLRI